jgi:hypothetical protein
METPILLASETTTPLLVMVKVPVPCSPTINPLPVLLWSKRPPETTSRPVGVVSPEV